MKYNFDQIVDRSKNHSVKYEEMYINCGSNDLIPLWIADMDFKTAEPIIEALHEKVNQGIFGYVNRPTEYFEAIRDWQLKRNGYEFKTDMMSFALGVVPALRDFLLLFSNEGDKVIIQQPVYHPFAEIVENTNRKLVVSNLKVDESLYYTMDFEDFEEKLKDGVKFFILCNPHNPCGRSWSKEELKKIGELCVKYGVQILSDEIHADLMLNGNKHTVMVSVSDEIAKITTTFTSSSKTFNLAGLQAATIIFADKEKQKVYESYIRTRDIARNNCFSLVATIAACKEGEEWLDQLREYIYGNMTFIKQFLDENIPLLKMRVPEATYLAWVDANALGMNDAELFKFVVEKAGVALGKGTDFGYGGSGFLRINTACPRSVLEKALTQLKTAVDGLNI